jgi:hypothetical protein
MNLTETGSEDMSWCEFTLDKVQWQNFLLMDVNKPSSRTK